VTYWLENEDVNGKLNWLRYANYSTNRMYVSSRGRIPCKSVILIDNVAKRMEIVGKIKDCDKNQSILSLIRKRYVCVSHNETLVFVSRCRRLVII
jgi:hypothetical protein